MKHALFTICTLFNLKKLKRFLNITEYKIREKQGRISKTFKGMEKIFPGGHNIYPLVTESHKSTGNYRLRLSTLHVHVLLY